MKYVRTRIAVSIQALTDMPLKKYVLGQYLQLEPYLPILIL